jgi:hypothetical protein
LALLDVDWAVSFAKSAAGMFSVSKKKYVSVVSTLSVMPP